MQGVVGVLLVALGAFLLQMETISWAHFEARRIFPREKGPLLMLGVALIFSITTIFAKRALDASSPLYFSSVYFALIAIGLSPMQFRVENGWKLLVTQPKQLLPLGFCEASSFLVQFFAMATAPAAYVIAIKRLSLLLSVLYGWLFFQEKNLGTRLFGAGIMALGAILIALA
jgi:drug/metabolite transporter (DMT)-like permease